jgi:hypothetical protein
MAGFHHACTEVDFYFIVEDTFYRQGSVPGQQLRSAKRQGVPIGILPKPSNFKVVPGIDGLTSGKEYAFRVCGIGTNPIMVFTDVITAYVL